MLARIFFIDVGDFTCLAGFFSLMWEILHAYRERGRNSVPGGDSLTMRESWKPCIMQIEFGIYKRLTPANGTNK